MIERVGQLRNERVQEFCVGESLGFYMVGICVKLHILRPNKVIGLT